MKHVQRAAFVVVVAGAAAFGVGSAAFGQTVTDPTGSVSVGVPVGGGGSDAAASVLAVSIGGTAQGPIALGDGNTYGTISISTDGDAYGGMCWNPASIGCLPSIAFTDGGWDDAHGGTVSYGGASCSAADWGPVPGIAVCSGSAHTEERADGSIALMTSDGEAHGRLLAYSQGNPSYFASSDAYSDNVAVSEWSRAHGGKVAVSLHNSAYSGNGGVAIAGTTWTGGGWPNSADAYTGPGGVSVAGGSANGGAVAVAGGDATTSPGGLVAVSATGNASGGTVANIDTE